MKAKKILFVVAVFATGAYAQKNFGIIEVGCKKANEALEFIKDRLQKYCKNAETCCSPEDKAEAQK